MAKLLPIALPPFVLENNDLFGLPLFHNTARHSHIGKRRLTDLNCLAVRKHEYTVKGDRCAYLARDLFNPYCFPFRDLILLATCRYYSIHISNLPNPAKPEPNNGNLSILETEIDDYKLLIPPVKAILVHFIYLILLEMKMRVRPKNNLLVQGRFE